MSWIYVQISGFFITPEGVYLHPPGYAGEGPGKNNPAMQDVHNVGPLPVGWYTIGPAYENPKTGPITMDLTPDTGNEMFGRADFRIHGDTIENPGNASEGCIVQSRANRITVNLSPDKRLQVVAELPNDREQVQEALRNEN